MGNLSSLDFTNSSDTVNSSANLNPEELLDLNNKIQSIALFNDAYITSVVDKLPAFGVEESADEGGSTGDGKSGTVKDSLEASLRSEDHKVKLLKLLKIFAPENKTAEKVEDHPILSSESGMTSKSTKAQSGFEIMRLRRTRLLIQLFKNYHFQEIFQLKKRGSIANFEDGKFWKLPALPTSQSLVNSNQTLITNLSFGMTLTIARALGSQNPMMLKGLLDFVLQTLSSFQFDLMKSNADFEATAISLWDFANEFFESPSSPVDVKNAALSILLAVALRTGTVNRIIRVVQYLFRDDVMIDRRIYGLIHTICDILPNFNLYPPSNKGASDKFFFSVPDTAIQDGHNTEQQNKWSRNKSHSTAIAAQGSFLYLMDAINYTLVKLHSGDNGTIPGEIILTKHNIYDVIKDFKNSNGLTLFEMSPDASKNPEQGEFICFSSKYKSPSIILALNKLDARRPSRNGKKYCSIVVDIQFPTTFPPIPTNESESLNDESCRKEDYLGYAYFEVKIVNLPDSQVCGIGFVNLQTFDVDGSRMIGWDEGHYGYHSDDGLLYGQNKENVEVAWPKWSDGDTIGCGIDYNSGHIFYAHNGVFLGNAFSIFASGTPENLVPCVTMKGERIEVKLNTGQSPFLLQHEELILGPLKWKHALSMKKQANDDNNGDRPISNTSISVIDQKLYLRLETLLFAHEIAVFDAGSLELLDVKDLSASVSETRAVNPLQSGLTVNSSAELFVFDLSKDQEILLRVAKGYSLELVNAVVDESLSVTDDLRNYLNVAKTSFYHANISQLLKSRHGQDIKTLALSFGTTQQLTKQTLNLPITSAGHDLVVLRSVFNASEKTKKVYNIFDEVTIVSAVSSREGGDSVSSSSFKELAVKLWKSHLCRLHEVDANLDGSNNSSSIDFTEIFRQDWQEFTELLGDISDDDDGDSESERSSSDESRSEKNKEKKDINFVVDFKIANGSSHSIQFQKSCDWSKIVQIVEDHFSAGTDHYIIDIYDESNDGRIVASIPLQSSDKFGKWRNVGECSLLYNGYQLVLVTPEWTDSIDAPEQIINKHWSYSLMKNGSLEAFSKRKFSVSYGLPVSLSYDCRANTIWAYDSVNRQFLKWRNSGLAPIYMNLYSRTKGYIYDYPTERVNKLRARIDQLSSKELGSLLLMILEKLSEPYLSQIGSVGSSAATASSTSSNDGDGFHRVRLTAKCYDSSSLGEQKCLISVQNVPLTFEDEEADDHTGYHVAVLDPYDFSVAKVRHFDNENDDFAPQRMSEFIDDLPIGTIVLIANANCIHDSMESQHYEALTLLGIEDLESEEDVRSLVAIGRKGLDPGRADYVLGKKNEVITLQRNLPVISIPYQLEPTATNSSTLLDLSVNLFHRIRAYGGGEIAEELIVEFTAILRIFICNLYNIISRSNIVDRALLIPAADMEKLEGFTLELVVSQLTTTYPLIRNAALSLFSTSFDLLYPKQSDKMKVLKKYADKYVRKEATLSEVGLLETLLSNLSDPTLFIEIEVEKQINKYSYQAAFEMIELCATIIQEEQQRYFANALENKLALTSISYSTTFQSAMALLNSLCKFSIACDVDSTLYQQKPVAAAIPSSAATTFEPLTTLRILLTLTDLSREYLQRFIAWKAVALGDLPLPLDLLQGIQQSTVGTVFPIVLMTATEIVASGGFRLINNCMELILHLINNLIDVLKLINQILLDFPKDATNYVDTTPGRQAFSKVYESEHPYRSNMDERTPMSFPGATSVTIVFDNACRTEHNCDFVQFLSKDGEVLHDDIGNKFSGRDGSENFPGSGGRPPLTLPVNEFVLYFHSDGSVEDWGYKFTLTVNYPLKLSGQNRSNWLLKLSFEIERCLSVIASELIQGPAWNEELEPNYTPWMENVLVKPEYFQYQLEVESSADKFLMDFIDRPLDSLADKFVKKIKQEVQEDQGTIESVNKAVYATCAAILRVNGLTQEAVAYAQDLRSEVSPALKKAWKAGQKMRSYFSLGDLKASLQQSDNTAGRKASGKNKKLSLYSGADEEVIDSACKAVVNRARFLLRVPLKDFRINENDSSTGIDGASTPLTSSPLKQLETLSPFTIPTNENKGESLLGPDLGSLENSGGSSSPSKAGPSRWQLAARAVNLKRQMSNETKNVVEMWHSLVGEAVAVDKLRNVFLHRRKFAERTRSGKELTPTERVLQFVQSDVEISKLHEMNHLRNKRAISRAKGFDIISQILNEQIFPFGISIALNALVSSLNKAKKKETGTTHYANGLEGCSPEQMNMLGDKVSLFLKGCVQIIQRAKAVCFENVEGDAPTWQNTLLSALRAFAMDFDFSDSISVLDSGILEALESLLMVDSSPTVVADTAAAVLQILVGRFIVVDGVSPDMTVTPHVGALEPAELSKRLIFLVSNLLNHASNPLLKAPSITLETTSLLSSGSFHPTPLQISSTLKISAFGSAYAESGIPLSLEHSLAFSVRRAPSSLLDDLNSLKKLDLVGKAVIRGREWDEMDESRKDSDGGLGNVGIITSLVEEEGKVKVKWNGSLSNNDPAYRFNFDLVKPNKGTDDKKRKSSGEVCLADPSVAGYVFSKGSSQISSYFELREKIPWITHISLQILADGSLLFLYQTFGKENFVLRSNAVVSSKVYTHVVLSFDGTSVARLFVDGELDSVSEKLFPLLLNDETKENWEVSPSSAPVTLRPKFKDATGLVVTFNDSNDLNGVTLKLHANNMSWSEEIDCLGNSSPALIVPDRELSLSLVAANNEKDKDVHLTGSVFPLNNQIMQESSILTTHLPFYFGHPPRHFQNSSLTNAFTQGFEGQISSFFLYNKALNQNDVKQLYEYCNVAARDNTPPFPEQTVLNMFSIVKRAVDSLDGLSDSSMKRCFANSGLISIIFQYFVRGTAVVRCSAYRLAAFILPFMDIELVDGHATRLGLMPKTYSGGVGSGIFLHYLLQQIGEFHHIFQYRCDEAKIGSDIKHKPLESTEERQAIIEAQILLFKSFAREQSLWYSLLQELLRDKVHAALPVIQDFKDGYEKESTLSEKQDRRNPYTFPNFSAAQDIIALFVVFGASSLSISIGSSCTYTDPTTSMKEVVTVLGPTVKPLLEKASTEEEKKKWEGLSQYGDVVAIMTLPSSTVPLTSSDGSNQGNSASNAFVSATEEILLVPRIHLSPLLKEVSIVSHFTQFLFSSLEKLRIKDLFRAIFAMNVVDRRPQPVALELDVVEEVLFESSHNYEDNMNEFKNISVNGAYKYEISFDEQSRTENNTDYVRFYKDVKKQEPVGVSYCGRDGDQNWCGCEGREPLIVMGPELFMEFHSDASGNDWGYKFSVKAHCKRVKIPPNLPFLPYYGITTQLKMLGSIAFHKLLQSDERITQHSFDLLESVMISALTPKPETIVPVRVDPPKPEMVFESNHPYEDNLDVYIPVVVPNAKKLIITFDAETRTESNCDYMDLFTDDSHSNKVPNSERWTGGKDGGSSNWPGIQGRPPFVMDGNSFVIYFHSDGSVNDWGWKMYVKGEGGENGTSETNAIAGVRGENLDGNDAIQCYQTLFEVISDGIGSTPIKIYDALNLFDSKKTTKSLFSDTLLREIEESKDESLFFESKESESSNAGTSPLKIASTIPYRINHYREDVYVVSGDGCKVYDVPSLEEGKVLETLAVGQKVVVVEEQAKWLKIRYVENGLPDSSVEPRGWILRRKNDENFVETDFLSSSSFVEEVCSAGTSSALLTSDKSNKSDDSDANIHAMYNVVDPKSSQASKGNLNNKISPTRIIQQDYDSIDQALTDYASIATIHYSHDILDKILSNWPNDLSISTHPKHPVSLSLLLKYLHHLLLQRSNTVLSPRQIQLATNQAKQLFSILLRESRLLHPSEHNANVKSDDPIKQLVNLAKRILDTSSKGGSGTEYRVPPIKRGKVQTLESTHPYEHNLDKDWPIKFPGAKRIEIIFSEESATETTYDYITIYDLAKENKLYPHKIHGFKNESRRHFPGVGNVPAVVLEGVDSCLINFVTDSGTNDWGWKLFAYGIYDYPEKAEIKEYEQFQQGAALRKEESLKQPALAIWILKELTNHYKELTDVNKILFFSVEMFRSLIIFFNSPESDPYKTDLFDIFLVFIQVFTAWLASYPSSSNGSSSANVSNSEDRAIIVMMNDVYLDIKELETSLVRSAQDLHVKNTEDGSDLLKVTPALQANAQFVITVGNFLSLLESTLYREGLTTALTAAEVTALPIQQLSCADNSSNSPDKVTWQTLIVPISSRSRALVAWDVRINSLPSGKLPVFGLIDANSTSNSRSWLNSAKCLGEFGAEVELEIGYVIENRSLLFNGGLNVSYGKHMKTLSEGDVVTVILDRIQGTLSFAINQVFLPVAIGGPKLQPALELNLVNADVYFAVSVPNLADDSSFHSFFDITWNSSLVGQNISKFNQFIKSSTAFSTDSSSTVPPTTPSLGAGPRTDWLVSVNDLSVLLNSIHHQQIPESILQQKFVPYCNRTSSKVIYHDNVDTALTPSSNFEEIFHFPQAASINLLLQQLTLHESDRIEGFDISGRLILSITAPNQRKKPTFENTDKYIYDLTIKSFDRQSGKYRGGNVDNSFNSASRPGSLSVGDKVIRGPNYRYGMEDGGAGSLGVVTTVQDWKGAPNAGVVVRWEKTNQESVYRYNYQGQFDIELFAASDSDKKLKVASNGTWQYATDYIRLKYHISEDIMSERQIKAVIVPLFPVAVCVANPSYESLRERLAKLYAPQKRSYFTEVVRHLNAFARTKNIEIDELLTKKWSDVAPSSEDLIRSAVLKELAELDAVNLEETIVKGGGGLEKDQGSIRHEERREEEIAIDPERISVSSNPIDGYLPEYALWNGIYDFDDLQSAILAAKQIYPECRGITLEPASTPPKYTLRKGSSVLPSPSGEKSWLLIHQPQSMSDIAGGLLSTLIDDGNSYSQGLDTGEIILLERDDIDNESNSVASEPTVEADSEEHSSSDDGDDGEDDEANWEDVEEENEEEGDDDENDSVQEETVEDDLEDSRSSSSRSSSGEENSNSSRSRSRSIPARSRSIDRDEVVKRVKKLQCGKCAKPLFRHVPGTWHAGWICDNPSHVGPNRFAATDAVWGCETVIQCDWGVCKTCWERLCSEHESSTKATETAVLSHTSQQKSEIKPIEAIYSIIVLLNYLTKKSLPFIDLSRNGDKVVPNSLAYYLFYYRDMLLETLKQPVFQQNIQRTEAKAACFDLMLNRVRALRLAGQGKTDYDGKWSVFGQAFRKMHIMPPFNLRRADKLYTVKLLGERAQDAGGPYRESFDIYASELQSKTLPLLVRTANGRQAVGYNREKWILNPSATSSTHLEMFAFLGKLMGYAIRAKEYLALNIPSIIWKLLVNDTPTTEDLEGIDYSLVNSMELLRTIETTGVTSETFSSIFFETFTTTTSDDRVIELKPNGAAIEVTWENRQEYCDLVLQYRIHEFDRQALAIREGLATIIPLSLLSLFTWQQLEEMVCGSPEVDIKLLESMTEYSGCEANQAHVRMFWQALQEFSNEERSALIKFTWGRSRLPINAAGFTQRFKIQSFDRNPPDSYFPVAHTCFFSLELPRYSSLEIMKEKLRYAIFNCQAIDGDDTATGLAVAAMGWEEE